MKETTATVPPRLAREQALNAYSPNGFANIESYLKNLDALARYMDTGALPGVIADDATKTATALTIAFNYGKTCSQHHKAWVIEQMCRALLGNEYKTWIANATHGADGPNTYRWDVGMPP